MGSSPQSGGSAGRPQGPRSETTGEDQVLFAPWRLEYLEELDAKERASGPPGPTSGSFLADAWRAPQQDGKNLVVVRTGEGMVLLNKFPYAGGHLLAALGDARPRLLDYAPAQRAALWSLVEVAADLMERTLEPQGINFGLNQGRAAGAGVPQHLHVHLVPRWSGDVNFISVVGRIRIIPSSLEAMAERYRGVWAGMKAGGEAKALGDTGGV